MIRNYAFGFNLVFEFSLNVCVYLFCNGFLKKFCAVWTFLISSTQSSLCFRKRAKLFVGHFAVDERQSWPFCRLLLLLFRLLLLSPFLSASAWLNMIKIRKTKFCDQSSAEIAAFDVVQHCTMVVWSGIFSKVKKWYDRRDSERRKGVKPRKRPSV